MEFYRGNLQYFKGRCGKTYIFLRKMHFFNHFAVCLYFAARFFI